MFTEAIRRREVNLEDRENRLKLPFVERVAMI